MGRSQKSGVSRIRTKNSKRSVRSKTKRARGGGGNNNNSIPLAVKTGNLRNNARSVLSVLHSHLIDPTSKSHPVHRFTSKELSTMFAPLSREFAETVREAPLRNTETKVTAPVKWRSLFPAALALRLSPKAPLKELADLAEEGALTYLEWLSLEYHKMDEPAFPALVAAFPKLSHLTSLHLTKTEFKAPKDCAALLNATSPSLTSLSLWGTTNCVNDAVATVLPRFRHLQHLNVSGHFNKDLLSVLRPALVKLSELRELFISGNLLGPEGADKLSEIVVHMPHLKVLKAGSNSFGYREDYTGEHWGGIGVLVAALRTCHNLEHLDLHTNRLGDVGILSLSPFLSDCRSLKVLNLASNEIHDIDTIDPEDDKLKSPIQVLVESLPVSLETLYLFGTVINEKGVDAFLEKLPLMKHLKLLHLSVYPSPGKEAIKAKAAEVLPDCNVVL